MGAQFHVLETLAPLNQKRIRKVSLVHTCADSVYDTETHNTSALPQPPQPSTPATHCHTVFSVQECVQLEGEE